MLMLLSKRYFHITTTTTTHTATATAATVRIARPVRTAQHGKWVIADLDLSPTVDQRWPAHTPYRPAIR